MESTENSESADTSIPRSAFDDILFESEEELLTRLYRFRKEGVAATPLTDIAATFKLRKEQLICALGFNPEIRYLVELLPVLGYATINELDQERNAIFVSDIYKRVSVNNIIRVYERIRENPEMLKVMQYLLASRLDKIESEIESTVNSMIIDKYKTEMRNVYSLGIASIDFIEDRLDRTDSGFRALLNEVTMIVENRLIPVGEIFFRNTILPQEKQRLLAKGLIPRELVQSRLNDSALPLDEKRILSDYLKTVRDQTTD